MIICKIFLNQTILEPHFMQAVYGFLKLEKDGYINLTFNYDELNLPNHMFYLKVNGIKVLYDMADGLWNNNSPDQLDKLLDNYDFLYKRSYSEQGFSSLRNRHKIKPYGLNYNIFCHSLRGLRLERRIPCLKYLLNSPDKHWSARKKSETSSQILLYTRLWDSENIPDNAEKKQREEINGMRIECVRALKKNFKNRAITGISTSPYAKKMCPDLILSKASTLRTTYLNILRNSKICIATTGLHNSIGWRFAEYVASGKAILSDPLHFQVPGKFSDGKNYLSFTSPEQLCELCEQLLADKELCEDMERNNLFYYMSHLRPDALILNTLKSSLEQIDLHEGYSLFLNH